MLSDIIAVNTLIIRDDDYLDPRSSYPGTGVSCKPWVSGGKYRLVYNWNSDYEEYQKKYMLTGSHAFNIEIGLSLPGGTSRMLVVLHSEIVRGSEVDRIIDSAKQNHHIIRTYRMYSTLTTQVNQNYSYEVTIKYVYKKPGVMIDKVEIDIPIDVGNDLYTVYEVHCRQYKPWKVGDQEDDK